MRTEIYFIKGYDAEQTPTIVTSFLKKKQADKFAEACNHHMKYKRYFDSEKQWEKLHPAGPAYSDINNYMVQPIMLEDPWPDDLGIEEVALACYELTGLLDSAIATMRRRGLQKSAKFLTERASYRGPSARVANKIKMIVQGYF